MGIISKPNTHAPNTVISSSKLNANEDTVYNAFNGNIEAANLATDAVVTAKIADSNVTTAKIADLNVTTGKLAADAVTNAKLADASILPEQLIAGTGTTWAWQSWTPTLSGRLDDADWTKTSCKYVQIGKTVIAQLKLVATAAAPMGGGSTGALFTLPVTSTALGATADSIPLGSAALLDSSTAVFSGIVLHQSTTLGTIRYHNQATAAYSSVSSTAPFTWTTNDEIMATFMYEAA